MTAAQTQTLGTLPADVAETLRMLDENFPRSLDWEAEDGSIYFSVKCDGVTQTGCIPEGDYRVTWYC